MTNRIIEILKKYISYYYDLRVIEEKDIPSIASEIESEMYENMQYYMEYCQREGYVTPQEWIEKHKHF